MINLRLIELWSFMTTGEDVYKANILMTCNWLIGIGGFYNETEDLFILPCAVLAGKTYHTLMYQVTSCKKFYKINMIERFLRQKSI